MNRYINFFAPYCTWLSSGARKPIISIISIQKIRGQECHKQKFLLAGRILRLLHYKMLQYRSVIFYWNSSSSNPSLLLLSFQEKREPVFARTYGTVLWGAVPRNKEIREDSNEPLGLRKTKQQKNGGYIRNVLLLLLLLSLFVGRVAQSV